MSYIETVSRDALAKASADIESARRALGLAAALLLLLHLLTITPYVQVSTHLAGLENDTAAAAMLSQNLEAQRKAIETAKNQANSELDSALNQATQEMMQSFASLDDIIAGKPMSSPVAQFQAPRQPLPETDRLVAIAAGVRQDDAGATKELDQYARKNIVSPAYQKVNQTWNDRIRPALIASIEKAEKSVVQAATLIPHQTDATNAGRSLAMVLNDTQAALTRARGGIEKMQLTPDQSVSRALGEEWWKSVVGKGHQANAVANAAQQQLKGVNLDAAVESFAQVTAAQEQARARLVEQQKMLEKDLAESQKDIASLAGSSAVLPIHAKTLIGLFPLVLGFVLAVMVLRVAGCRNAAARAAKDLAGASTDEQVRSWLMRRAETGKNSLAVELVFLPLAAIVWIAFAASQINTATDALRPALPVLLSAGLGITAVLVAVGWNYASIRRLSASLRFSE